MDYLIALGDAERNGQVINYRVARQPKKVQKGDLCYIVYNDTLIGYNVIVDVVEKKEDEVLDPRTGDYWPAGWYIVRDPAWHPAAPKPMKSFRGFRYLED